MSHWTLYRLRLLNPSFQLLKEACERVAEKLGSRLAYNFEVRHVSGRREVCPLGIPLKHSWSNGVGVKVEEDGAVTVVGDHALSKRVALLLEAEYAALAVARAAEAAGFQVERSEQGDTVTLTLKRGGRVNVVAIRGGSLEIDASGYAGDECLRDADALTSNLPGVQLTVEKRVLKPEAERREGSALIIGPAQLPLRALRGAGFALKRVNLSPFCG